MDSFVAITLRISAIEPMRSRLTPMTSLLQTSLSGGVTFFDTINLNAFRPVFQLSVAQRRS